MCIHCKGGLQGEETGNTDKVYPSITHPHLHTQDVYHCRLSLKASIRVMRVITCRKEPQSTIYGRGSVYGKLDRESAEGATEYAKKDILGRGR